MKKNKGFTLIELLAVIVILAIIALIAVPVVMNIINKASKSAFKDSAYGLIKAGELFYADMLLENAGLSKDQTFNFPNNIEGLEFKGSKPSKGSMTVNKDGKIAMAISNGKYCVTKGFEDADISITDDIEDCEIIVPGTLRALATTGTFTTVDGTTTSEVSEVDDCAKSGTCKAGTAFAIKVNNTETYKFYVLSDTGEEVTLIMARNLYSEEDLENNAHNVAWYKIDDEEKEVTNTQGPLTALKELKERTSGWTNIPTYTYILKNDNDGYAGPNTYLDIAGDLVTDIVARLPRREEIYALNESGDLIYTPWLYENLINAGDNNVSGYWTSSAATSVSKQAWIVTTGFGLVAYDVDYVHKSQGYGLRPVITLTK